MSEIEVKLVKNITHKTGGLEPRDLRAGSPALFMTRLTGVVETVKTFEDRTGTMKTVFIGDFTANGADGTVSTSEKMFLFNALQEKLQGAWASGGEKAIEFSYDVFAIYNEKSATRYSYEAKPVTPTATNDRMHALMTKVNAVPLPTNKPKEATEVPASGGKKK